MDSVPLSLALTVKTFFDNEFWYLLFAKQNMCLRLFSATILKVKIVKFCDFE